MEAINDCREWRKIQTLLRRYDNVCDKWKFTGFPFIHNGNILWNVLIQDFTVILRRLATFTLKIREFRNLTRTQQCKQLQRSSSTLLVLQCGLFIYEMNNAILVNLSLIERENVNVIMRFLYSLFSQPEFTVCLTFLNKLCELDADRYIFVILTVIALLEIEEPNNSYVKLNTNYVKLLQTYIRLKYTDPGWSFLINFYILEALREFEDGMKELGFEQNSTA